jgi:hypothetical protein
MEGELQVEYLTEINTPQLIKTSFGTKLRITNQANGQSVIVEVTDRGPCKIQRY